MVPIGRAAVHAPSPAQGDRIPAVPQLAVAGGARDLSDGHHACVRPPVSRRALRQRDPDPRRPCRLPANRILSPAFVSANLLMCWSSFEAFWKPYLALV